MSQGAGKIGRPDDPLSEAIIGACIEVHRCLGPGLLESVYEECLCHEVNLRGIHFRRQVNIPVVYKGLALGSSYRIDVLVEEQIVVELKSVDEVSSLHVAQLLTYLKLTDKEVGLLVNFNVALVKHGVRRLTHRKNSLWAPRLPDSL